MKYIVITIDPDGTVFWISRCRNMRGAQQSKRYSLSMAPEGTEVRILSVEDILHWDGSGLRELEAMYKL